MAFGRTKAAIAKGQQIKEAVKSAPANAQAAAAAAAKASGRRLINGSSHCKMNPNGKRQHTPAFSKQKDMWTDPDTGHQYQLMLCRNCGDVIKAMPIGRKN